MFRFELIEEWLNIGGAFGHNGEFKFLGHAAIVSQTDGAPMAARGPRLGLATLSVRAEPY